VDPLGLKLRVGTRILLLAAASLTCSGDSTGVGGSDAAEIRVVGGAGQQGVAGEALAEPIVVQLLDSAGRPLRGQEIGFRVVSGGGAVDPAGAVTDDEGKAAVSGRLGTVAGPWAMEANAGGGVRAQVSATAVAAAPDSMFLVRGQGQSGPAGELLGDSLVVEVVDRYGNPAPGAEVSWQVSGLGSVSAGLVATGTDGRAAVTRRLGPIPGLQITRAVLEGLKGSPLEFNHAAFPAQQTTEPLGRWSGVESWPVVAIHLHLLPNGKVFAWGKSGDPQVWDPATNTFAAIPSPVWVFCGGHAFLPDGRLLVTGGHIDDGVGLTVTSS
jgi:hypothetical protein